MFFLIGAPRCATTSLFTWFETHPEVYVPEMKEPHYFACPEVQDTYYDVPIISEADEYSRLYQARPPGILAGDFSSSYLFRDVAAKRIKQVVPEAKIIAVLRNPVERSISHYRMDYRDGYTSEPLEEILRSTHRDPRFRREYLSVGRYSRSIRRWQDQFPQEQIKVIFYDDLVSEWTTTTNNLSAFLGISELKGQQQFRNAGTGPPAQVLRRLSRSNTARRVANRVSPATRQRLIATLSAPAPHIQPSTVRRLQDIFAAEIDVLEVQLDRDLSHWRILDAERVAASGRA